jgi:hypothetical protein
MSLSQLEIKMVNIALLFRPNWVFEFWKNNETEFQK